MFEAGILAALLLCETPPMRTCIAPPPLPSVPVERSHKEQQAITQIQSTWGIVRQLAPGDPRLEIRIRFYQSSQVTDASLFPIASIENLYELDLGRSNISNRGVAHLEKLKQLRKLKLHTTTIGDHALTHLSGLENLEILNLHSTDVSDSGLEYLKGLKKLQKLYVWRTNVTADGILQLKKSLPHLTVIAGVERVNPNPLTLTTYDGTSSIEVE